MPFCNSCGKEIDASTTYCPYCGAEVIKQQQSYEQPSLPPITQPGQPNVPPPPALQPGTAGFPPPPSYSAPPPGPPYQQPVYPSIAPAVERSRSQLVTGLLGIGSMALAVLGSFLPWVSVFGISTSGMEGDGKITLITAIIAGIFFAIALAANKKWPFIVSLLLALVTAAVFIVDLMDISDAGGMAVVGAGMYIGLIGACAGLVFSIMGLALRK